MLCYFALICNCQLTHLIKKKKKKRHRSLFQQGVLQNQGTELNLHSSSTVKCVFLEVMWVFIVQFQIILLVYVSIGYEPQCSISKPSCHEH